MTAFYAFWLADQQDELTRRTGNRKAPHHFRIELARPSPCGLAVGAFRLPVRLACVAIHPPHASIETMGL
jgi:hypothetical protein